MGDDPVDAIAGMAARAEVGDAAAKQALFAALYSELHRLAQAHLHRATGPVTLSATTLLHEAYLDIAKRDALAFPDRNRFLGYASRAMRGLIVDYVRQRTARKRGGEFTLTSLPDDAGSPEPSVDLERLDSALKDLASLDPSLAELVAPFVTSTPLWYYILKEADLLENGNHLGPVGGRLVAEVFIGLLQLDSNSYLNTQPDFTPSLGSVPGSFQMTDFLTFAGVAEKR